MEGAVPLRSWRWSEIIGLLIVRRRRSPAPKGFYCTCTSKGKLGVAARESESRWKLDTSYRFHMCLCTTKTKNQWQWKLKLGTQERIQQNPQGDDGIEARTWHGLDSIDRLIGSSKEWEWGFGMRGEKGESVWEGEGVEILDRFGYCS